MENEREELLDFRESPRLVQASTSIKDRCSELLYSCLMLAVQGVADDLKDAEERIINMAKTAIVMYDGKRKIGMSHIVELLNAGGIYSQQQSQNIQQ